MRLLPFALLALTLAAPLGCRRSMAPICRQLCVCSPCTQDDFDACVTKAETAQSSAEKSECAAPFDDLVSCLEDNLSCRPANSPNPGPDSKCNRADRAMVLCDGSVSPFGNACEEEPIKRQACSGSIPTTPVQPAVPCTNFSECIAQCALAQPCDVLNGTASPLPLTDCITACQMKMGGSGTGGGPKHQRP